MAQERKNRTVRNLREIASLRMVTKSGIVRAASRPTEDRQRMDAFCRTGGASRVIQGHERLDLTSLPQISSPYNGRNLVWRRFPLRFRALSARTLDKCYAIAEEETIYAHRISGREPPLPA
jgi:hypothetical protein